jgi:hypothetical protein
MSRREVKNDNGIDIRFRGWIWENVREICNEKYVEIQNITVIINCTVGNLKKWFRKYVFIL